MRETRVLRHLPVFDLKWSLLKQVAAVALLCFLVGAAFSVHQAEQETLKANRAVADTVGRFLEMPLLSRHELQTHSDRALICKGAFVRWTPFTTS